MRFYNEHGEIRSFHEAQFRKIRVDHSKTLVMSEQYHEAVKDAVMLLGGIADNFRDYHTSAGDSSVFDDPSVLEAVKKLGQKLYDMGGTALMMRVADQLYTFMVMVVEQKATYHSIEHYEIFMQELDHVWQGIGDQSGKPIIDYWQA